MRCVWSGPSIFKIMLGFVHPRKSKCPSRWTQNKSQISCFSWWKILLFCRPLNFGIVSPPHFYALLIHFIFSRSIWNHTCSHNDCFAVWFISHFVSSFICFSVSSQTAVLDEMAVYKTFLYVCVFVYVIDRRTVTLNSDDSIIVDHKITCHQVYGLVCKGRYIINVLHWCYIPRTVLMWVVQQKSFVQSDAKLLTWRTSMWVNVLVLPLGMHLFSLKLLWWIISHLWFSL